MNKKAERNSSIEALKVFAMWAIILNHVCQTLGDSDNTYINYHDYVLPLRMATTDIQSLIMSILRYGGSFGNTVFFVCTCWFLLDSKKASVKKIVFMLLDIWTISVIILIAVCVVMSGTIDGKLIVKSLFPTFFSNNWYLTCYMLFYAMHPFLNNIIYSLNQKQLLKVSIVLSFLYIFCNFVISSFESSNITLWVAIYFCIAYIKLYLKNFALNKKANCGLVVFGLVGNICVILLTNYLGLKISFFQNMILRWNRNAQPFFVIAAIGLFNLTNHSSYKNRFINELSGLSLLIYIIHENILIRTYFRPFLFQYIYKAYGYDHILCWVLLLSILIFAASILISALYKVSIQKFVKKIGGKIYISLCNGYMIVEKAILRIK